MTAPPTPAAKHAGLTTALKGLPDSTTLELTAVDPPAQQRHYPRGVLTVGEFRALLAAGARLVEAERLLVEHNTGDLEGQFYAPADGECLVPGEPDRQCVHCGEVWYSGTLEGPAPHAPTCLVVRTAAFLSPATATEEPR